MLIFAVERYRIGNRLWNDPTEIRILSRKKLCYNKCIACLNRNFIGENRNRLKFFLISQTFDNFFYGF